MKHKLSQKSGLTLVELLVVIVIVMLITAAAAAGMTAASRAYRSVTTISEAQTLAGTLVTEISDELRFATEVKSVSNAITFDSERYGYNCRISTKDGYVIIGDGDNAIRVLGKNAYMGLIAEVSVAYNDTDEVIDVELIIKDNNQKWDTVNFSVKPLNTIKVS